MKNIIFVSIVIVAVMCILGSTAQAKQDTTSSIGIRLVCIEPGTFQMGQQSGGDFDERPVHKVTISKPFYMAATEVTNSQYEKFDPSHRKFRGLHGLSKDDNEPVLFVSWHDAVAFCEWLSKKDSKSFRLPTEAEWEYAARAGTTTAFNTGNNLPRRYHKNQKQNWEPKPVKLHVAKTPANQWGLYDMHGNVEEWCYDWYGPYTATDQIDPVGRKTGDFKVTRGGSHGTEVKYLRSANRMATLPEDKAWLTGFRIVMADLLDTTPLGKPQKGLWARNVNPEKYNWPAKSKQNQPHFFGPIEFVKISTNSNGPMFSKHNHCPAITVCPNGDLLTVWYSTNTEPGRELTVVASRLRKGATKWEPAEPFWDVPDRNDHGNEVWWDGKDTIYHFNGMGTDATWGKLALVMRTSNDSGATWSKAKLINPNHGLRNQVISGAFQTSSGAIVLKCDAVTGGTGGTAIHISRDAGKTWNEPGAGKAKPKFAAGKSGAWIAGIHAGVVELDDGKLMALGRGDDIGGRMPMSISDDMGQTWTYSASEFPSISSGQRLVLMRLRQGSILLVSFTDSSKKLRSRKGLSIGGKQVYGLFAAISTDNGKTWPVKKLITPGGNAKTLDGGAWTREFTLDDTHAEPKGYLAATQSPDGMIHLISSKLYYRFNIAWMKASASE